jgi:RimJ/RimL family protein N-acetyltransferase
LEVVGKSRSGIQQYWLRPLGLDDIPVITKWLADIEDLAMFDRRVPVPLNRASMEAEWQSDIVGREPRTCYWFMIDDDQGVETGMAGLIHISYVHGDALMPIFIAEGSRGQGIGLRTRALLLDLAFDQLRLVRITSLHRADNAASHGLNEACAFRQEGCVRKGNFAGGRHIDQLIYGLLAEEWRAHRDTLRARLSSEVVVTLGSKPWGPWSWPQLPIGGKATDDQS